MADPDLRQDVSKAGHDVLDLLDKLRAKPDVERNEAVTRGQWLARQAYNTPRRRDLRSYVIKAAAHFILAAEILDAEAGHG